MDYTQFFIFAVSISFISWLVGLIGLALIKNKQFFKHLSNLQFIKNSKLQNSIGLNGFAWIIKNTPFKFFNLKLYVISNLTLSDLQKLKTEMTHAEISHLIAFIFVCVFAVYKSIVVHPVMGVFIMFVNVLMNLYPSLLQQKNKLRINKLIKRYAPKA